ncbi:alpha/beta fold hydrolase [Alloalcanivorax mobilis]|uniref:alpha/beta fold hydrolase n=1 Tax=Alloalcanivorax mobilis TaxID=2019569 RepID=UPI000C7677BE|nr:alpha/beta hydrolase [Alloalcanivorax mobilis]
MSEHPFPYPATARSQVVRLQSTDCHLRQWGDPHAPTLFLLHGWLDTSVSFQFLADALGSGWRLIAPDWPGYGDTPGRPGPYWMYDDVAILDALLDQCAADQPVTLVGHSYGGQVATLYAAARPERVARCISLEGFGPPQVALADAPQRLAGWLDTIKQRPRHRPYRDRAALADRLSHANPRLTPERAAFLSRHIGQPDAGGELMLHMDDWRRLRGLPLSFPAADHFETMLAAIQAPTLWLRGDQSHYMANVFPTDALYQHRFQCLRHGQQALIENAGHNLHHDQPEVLAHHLLEFIERT